MLDIIHHFANMPLVELLAVVSSLFYVVLAANNNIWCWPAAMLSTVLYTIIFYEFYLWSDSLLQVYYFIMAVVGWLSWNKKKPETVQPNVASVEQYSLPIQSKTIGFNLIAIVCCSFGAFSLGWLMDNYTPTHFPYLDAATTVFSLFATYLVTQRVLENWLYWIVIDFVSIYLYVEKSLYPTVALFVFFTGFACYGYFKWRNLMQFQDQQAYS